MNEKTIVAWKERPADDPETGAPGILRDEWRIRSVDAFTPEELRRRFGIDWRIRHPGATRVLEHRYIRRGAEEAWEPFDCADSFEGCLEMIDARAFPVSPALLEMQVEACRTHYAECLKHEAEEEKKRVARERAEKYDAGNKAFQKLLISLLPEDRKLAEDWQKFAKAHKDDVEFTKRVRADVRFMELYEAGMTEHRLPSKRKAMREFLVYAKGF